MSFTLRKLAGTAALAVAASALTLPLAPAAVANGSVEREWTLADSNGDGSVGLSETDLPGGTTTVVDESATTNLSNLAVSADGTRLTYVRDTPTREQVIVRDYGGRVVRAVADVPLSGKITVLGPQLSPDGSTVVWTQADFTTSPPVLSIRKALVGAGAASTVGVSGCGAKGCGVLAFSDPNTLLVQTLAGANKTVPLAGGSVAPVTGLTNGAQQVTLSGSKIVWSVDTTGSGNSTADIHVGTISGTAVTDNGVLSGTLDNEEPTFSRDGSTVYWVQFDGHTGPGDVLHRPFDMSAAATTIATPSDEFDVAISSPPSADITAPADVTTLPAALNGTSATLRWTLPSDADLSGVLVSRPGKTAVYVPAPTSSLVDTGLAVGSTYVYTFKTVDRAGNMTAGVTRSLTAIKAGALFSSPTSNTSTRARFPVKFATTAPSNVAFWVDYLPAGTSTWRAWVAGATGVVRTFGAPASAHVLATTSTPGATYTFRVKATDAYGNTTARVVSGKAVVPYDQTKATLSGGATYASSAAYLGSYRRLSKTIDYAKVTLTGNRFQVIGFKCTSCGVFAIYDGRTLIGTVDTRAASTIARAVLFTRSYASVGTHTFTIRPKATAGRPYVLLDAFAMRR